MYEKRRQYRITSISLLLRTINNKVNYINGLLTNKLDLRGKASKTIEDMLIKYGLDKEKDSFHYLTKMAMDSVSKENVAKLLEQKDKLDNEYNMLQSSNAISIWLEDLEELEPFIQFQCFVFIGAMFRMFYRNCKITYIMFILNIT